jgi:hypothetical protein
VNLDPRVNAVVLESADHFQAGAVAYVGQARISMTAEVSLENPPVFGAVK